MINRFYELWEVLKETSSPSRALDRVDSTISLDMIELYSTIIKALPTGKDEVQLEGMNREPRPSIRQHGATLLNSFITTPPEATERTKRGEARHVTTMNLSHPTYDGGEIGILEWLIEGTDGHPISAPPEKDLFFYWERVGEWAKPAAVEHPGAKAKGDFIQAAVSKDYGERMKSLTDTAGVIAFDLFIKSPLLYHE